MTNNMANGSTAGNQFQFVFNGNPLMLGNGGSGCNSDCNEEFECDGCCDECEFSEDEFRTDISADLYREQISLCEADYNKIMNDAHISKWKKEETGEDAELYAFTQEQMEYLSINRSYLKENLLGVADEYEKLIDAYEQDAVPEVDKILRSGDATIVFWADDTKTIVKRAPDEPDSDYAAFTAALGKKLFGSNSALSRYIKSKIVYQTPKKKKAKDNPLPSYHEGEKWTSTSRTIPDAWYADNRKKPEEHVHAEC